jgi:MazG family protein
MNAAATELERMTKTKPINAIGGTADGHPEAIATLLAIMTKLRDPHTGCPWDAEQTFTSIVPYTIEEAYEVADAVERNDKEDLCDELGDLLLQVVFHAQMAEEEGSFSFDDVVAAVVRKMIRRHPHVFGDVDRDDTEAVNVRWEEIKAQEKAEKRARQLAKGEGPEGPDHQPASALDGVPTTLPALQRAHKLQAKAARVGFDWPQAKDVLAKLREETAEVEAEIQAKQRDRARIQDEIGDVLFVVTNLARKMDIDPALALEGTNKKFIKRFQWVEDYLRESDAPVGKASLETMEAAWQAAKSQA